MTGQEIAPLPIAHRRMVDTAQSRQFPDASSLADQVLNPHTALLDVPTRQVKFNVGRSIPRVLPVSKSLGVEILTYRTLGALVLALRKRLGLTQAALGAEIGVARSTIASIENGTDLPGRETLIALADFFKVPLDQLRGRPISPRAPRTREIIEDPDELAWLRFWRGLTPDQRKLVTKMIEVPDSADVPRG